MSDPDLEVIEIVKETTDKQTWARKLMNGFREAQALHHPETKYGGYDTQEEAEASGADYETTVICAECTLVAEELRGDDVSYWQEWPCRTAQAMGIENGPML